MQKRTNWRIVNWRKDADGILRVTAHVIREGVFPYSGEEESAPELAHLAEVLEYIPRSEFTAEALASLEGRDVTIPVPGEEHEWRTPEVARKDGLSVGSVAGTPFVTDDGKVQCDFLIPDAATIEAIASGQLVEVSAGYIGAIDVTPGEFNGQPYHAVQRDLRFNHILLLPPGQGRCGPDVRIINQKPKDRIMNFTVERRIGNAKTPARYNFTNAEDKAEAERMNEDAEQDLGARLNDALSGREEMKNEMARLNEELGGKDAAIAEIQAELEKALSPEAAEAVAEALVEQTGDEEAILETELANEAEVTEAVKNKRGNCRTMAGRRAAIVNAAAKKNTLDVSKWDQGRIDGYFAALAQSARKNRAEKGRVTMGGAQKIANSNHASSVDRMMSAWNGGAK